MESNKPWGMAVNTYCFLLHISQLAGFMIPGFGFIIPIVMWATNKDKYPEIDQHGKNVVNWLITAFIYSIICFVLTFVLIGALGFIILGIANIAFAIIGAIKANDGLVWRYPASFRFIK